jgi:hypothetical protein
VSSNEGLGVAVLTVSPLIQASGAAARLEAGLDASHRVVASAQLAYTDDRMRVVLACWLDDDGIDLIVVIGGEEAARNAIAPHADDWLDQPGARWRALGGSRASVTFAATQVACCGTKLVALVQDVVAPALVPMPPQLPVVPPPVRAMPPRAHQLTTGSITAIGDLPAVAVVPPMPRRGGAWIGIVSAVVVVVATVVSIDVLRAQPATDRDDVERMPAPNAAVAPVAAPAAPIAPPPAVAALQQPPSAPSPVHTAHTLPRHEPPAMPAPHVAVAAPPPGAAPVENAPPPAAPMTYDDPTACTQAGCAAHGNERDCCAPFRSLPHGLDRVMIAATVGAVKSRAMTCGTSSSGNELVRVVVDVTADGHVASASVLESPGEAIGACVADVLRATTFPTTATGGSFVARIDLGKG